MYAYSVREFDASRIGYHAQYSLYQSRFSAAVGPDDTGEVIGEKVERHVTKRRNAFVRHRYIMERHQFHER